MSGVPPFYEAVWQLVAEVPTGRVVTYGQVAGWLGKPRAARAVGYAMFNAPPDGVPWHRVINSRGEISVGGHLHRPGLQRGLLEQEGIDFDGHDRIELRRYGWTPPPAILQEFSAFGA